MLNVLQGTDNRLVASAVNGLYGSVRLCNSASAVAMLVQFSQMIEKLGNSKFGSRVVTQSCDSATARARDRLVTPPERIFPHAARQRNIFLSEKEMFEKYICEKRAQRENMDVSSLLLALPSGTNHSKPGRFITLRCSIQGDAGQMIRRTHMFHLSEGAEDDLPQSMRYSWSPGTANDSP